MKEAKYIYTETIAKTNFYVLSDHLLLDATKKRINIKRKQTEKWKSCKICNFHLIEPITLESNSHTNIKVELIQI